MPQTTEHPPSQNMFRTVPKDFSVYFSGLPVTWVTHPHKKEVWKHPLPWDFPLLFAGFFNCWQHLTALFAAEVGLHWQIQPAAVGGLGGPRNGWKLRKSSIYRWLMVIKRDAIDATNQNEDMNEILFMCVCVCVCTTSGSQTRLAGKSPIHDCKWRFGWDMYP